MEGASAGKRGGGGGRGGGQGGVVEVMGGFSSDY